MKTILFADDQKNVREYCRAAFAAEGYRVVLARDGIEALEMFIIQNPDVAVLDISMPRGDGMEALEQIKAISPHTPVILFTAHNKDCLGDSRATLATACIEKSGNLATLKQVVAQTLEQQNPEGRESPGMELPPFPARMEDGPLPSRHEGGAMRCPS